MDLTPQPVLAVYGAKAENSASAKLAGMLESSQRNNRLKTLPLTRDHALPLKKLVERKYDTYSPAQILKPDWSRKHQEDIPGGVLVCFETEALNLHAVQSAISLLDSVRANLHAASRHSIPTSLVLICTGKTPAMMEEERTVFTTHLKRVAAAPATMRLTPTNTGAFPSSTFAVVFAEADLVKNATPVVVNKLGQELMTLLLEHYHVEIARIKQIKPQQNFRIKARFEFKCAQMYEMRSLQAKAMAHYQQAYQALSLLVGSTSDDVLSAAEFIHYRMGAIRFATQEPKMALVQLRTHITAMSVYADWEWCSRQHVLFAGLISSQVKTPQQQLDAVERERLTPTYHFSRAAYFASRSSNNGKALELYEKLYEHEQKKQTTGKRCGREQLLLYYIAQARSKSGDVAGAGRDFERLVAGNKWKSTHALLLGKMDASTQQDSCVVPELSPIIALCDDPQRSARAREFMLQHNYSVEKDSALMNAVFDVGKHRLLLESKIGDLCLASCAGRHLSEQENKFTNGYLLLDPFHMSDNNSVVIVVTIQPTGAEWTLPLERATTKQFEHTLRQIPLVASVRILNSSSAITAIATKPMDEISIAGLPQDSCLFIGETLRIVLSTVFGDGIQAFQCRSDTLHIQRINNAQEFSIHVPATFDEHKALIYCSSDGDNAATKKVEVQVKWAMKSVLFHTVSSMAYSQIESMGDFLCTEASNNTTLLGTWRLQERRNVLSSLATTTEITLQRGENEIRFHLTPSVAAAVALEEEEGDDEITCKIKFNHSSFVTLGQEIDMQVKIQAKRATKVSISPTSEMDTPGFVLCGALQQQQTRMFAGQELHFQFSLVAQSLGPGKLPGVWVESTNGRRKQYMCADSQCLVLSMV